MMQDYTAYFEANKALWNRRTTIHKDSGFYDMPGFLAGRNMLNEIELNALGDVRGKSILHLQCHFGMDSLSLARMGAHVTGVDLSDEAIREAKALNEKLGLDARFICCNIYELPQYLDEQFDIVFTSYGVVGWLPDLQPWGALIAQYLKKGGMFFIAEFHPVVWMMDDDFTKITYAYHNRDIIITEQQGTYTDREADIKMKEYSWNHALGEVVNALIDHGLHINKLDEFPYSPYPCFNKVVQGKDGF